MADVREPPHAIDAERSVIGLVMTSAVALADVSALLQVDDFYLPAHREIYGAAMQLDQRRQPVDPIAVADELKARGYLARLDGGERYLLDLAGAAPLVEMAGHHARLVRRKAIFRKAIVVAAEMQARAQDAAGDPADLIDAAGRQLLALTAREASTLVHVRDLLGPTMDMIESRRNAPGRPIGLTTGIQAWDFMAGGLCDEHLIILAARPSLGKTSLARGIARHIAGVQVGADVLVFSLEESKFDMVEKWLVADASINNQAARRGLLQGPEWLRMQSAAGKLADCGLYIDDGSGRENNIGRIYAKARRWRAQNPTKKCLVVLDYLQLAESGLDRRENRAAEVSEISRTCKAMAKDLKLPVLAVAQLNRELEKEKRPPRQSDLRESGSIEQDADQIVFLHVPQTARGPAVSPGDPDASIVEGILAKNRGGPTGVFNMVFWKKYGRFENFAGDPDDVRLPYTEDQDQCP